MFKDDADDNSSEENVVAPDMKPFEKRGFTVGNFAFYPGWTERFNTDKVRRIIETTIRDEMTFEEYSENFAATVCVKIANHVRKEVKSVVNPKFRIVVHVVVGGLLNGLGTTGAVRCLWDPKTDSMIFDTMETDNFFCCVSVFGIYTQ
ncbi:dynein light chain Tctex-type protein 2B-like [Nilaparvata lugens]|uniref:dynein light chain Tctex-type protein 2B-like n=1 Tax=Nilaparvata lugens TaxID=108931 RepID=UPI00193C9A63|nr:dynein light chain Tctex-type protein 2B-like [Nilaparvata lugens]